MRKPFLWILAGLFSWSLMIAEAHSQVDRPGLSGGAIVGSTPGFTSDLRPPSARFGSSQTPKLHIGTNGKPCIYVVGQARAQTINPNVFEHVLILNNSCGLPIKLRICYYGTETCNDASIAAFARRQEIFGIMPNAKDFRFEYREYF